MRASVPGVSAALQRRAREALSSRLASLVDASAMHEDGVHTCDLRDALVPTLTAAEVAWVHGELARGAKGELRPTRAGAVLAHGAWTSTTLAGSAFAPWRRDPRTLSVAGLDGFDDVRLEERLLIPHGGGTPNLDVALTGGDVFAGVESKLTEHLAPRPRRPWATAYRRPAMLAALDGGWADVFAALLEGRWAPRFLGAAQLVKHALSLQAVARDTGAHLVLLYWEPQDGDRHGEVLAHREEVAELVERLGGDAVPAFRAQTYAELLTAWEPARPDHVAALRARYDVGVGLPAT